MPAIHGVGPASLPLSDSNPSFSTTTKSFSTFANVMVWIQGVCISLSLFSYLVYSTNSSLKTEQETFSFLPHSIDDVFSRSSLSLFLYLVWYLYTNKQDNKSTYLSIFFSSFLLILSLQRVSTDFLLIYEILSLGQIPPSFCAITGACDALSAYIFFGSICSLSSAVFSSVIFLDVLSVNKFFNPFGPTRVVHILIRLIFLCFIIEVCSLSLSLSLSLLLLISPPSIHLFLTSLSPLSLSPSLSHSLPLTRSVSFVRCIQFLSFTTLVAM